MNASGSGTLPDLDVDLSRRIGERIDAMLQLSDRTNSPVVELFKEYFNASDENSFAGSTFDTLAPNRPNSITPSDLLAVTLLDVRFTPAAVRALLSGGFDPLLAAVNASGSSLTIWDLPNSPATYKAANDLYWKIRAIHGVGPTLTTKLLTRKFPELIPIRDSVIEAFYELGAADWWLPLGNALADSTRRNRLEALAKPHQCSVLRVLDVAVWMLRSNSRAAKDARHKYGLSRDPWMPEH